MNNLGSSIGEIDMKVICIGGDMRNGKTALGVAIGVIDFRIWWEYTVGEYRFHRRIYGNVDIYHGDTLISRPIRSMTDIKKIKFSKMPGVLILDEVGINANSKAFGSKENMMLSECTFLAGKKNLSLIFIAQRIKSIPVDQRDLANLILRVKKIKRYNIDGSPSLPYFRVDRIRFRGKYDEHVVSSYYVDTLAELKRESITYDQLDESRLSHKL